MSATATGGARGLVVAGLTVRFGGHLAVSQVSFSAPQGRIVGLIGPNGAGKTTIFNAVCGVVQPTAGTVHLDGREISGLATHRRARLGLGRTFQRLEVFSSLSVWDNVLVGLEIRRGWARRAGCPPQFLAPGSDPDPPVEVELLLDRLGLAGLADQPVGSLPTGQARLVELARALAARPSVLLLDEPASGLDDGETQQFGAILGELAAAGLGILLVEHDMSLVMEVCHDLHVLDFGQLIASGTPEQIRTNAAVVDAYLGAGT